MKRKLSTIIKPASELRAKFYGEGEVLDYAWDILCTVNSAIKDSVENGQSECITEIQTIFEVGNMSLSTAQKHVYYRVVTELEKQGYKVLFKYSGKRANNQRVFIKVQWLTEKDDEYDKFITEELSRRVFE